MKVDYTRGEAASIARDHSGPADRMTRPERAARGMADFVSDLTGGSLSEVQERVLHAMIDAIAEAAAEEKRGEIATWLRLADTAARFCGAYSGEDDCRALADAIERDAY